MTEMSANAVTRGDLAWLLTATIPHLGKVRFGSVVLTIERDSLYACGFDGYTSAIARAALVRRVFGEPLAIKVTGKPSFQSQGEVNDLLRFVRPSTVGQREEPVELIATETELHVALDSGDSAVFAGEPASTPGLENIRGLLRVLDQLPDEEEVPNYNPQLLEKFAHAQRLGRDRMTWYPKRDKDGTVGVMLLTIGPNFVGGVSGMTRDDSVNPREVIADILQIPALKAA